MTTSEPNPVVAFLPLLLMFAVFYFLLIRPQQKKEKERQNLIRDLKKGDRIVTTGGLIGIVAGVKDSIVVLKVGDKETKLEVLKSSVSQIMSEEKEA